MASSILANFRAKGPVEFGLPMTHFEVPDVNGTIGMSSATASAFNTATSGDCQVGMRWFQAKIFQKAYGTLNGYSSSTVATFNQGYVLEVSNNSAFSQDNRGNVMAVAFGAIDSTQSYQSVYLQGFAAQQTYQFVRVRFCGIVNSSATFDTFIDAAP